MTAVVNSPEGKPRATTGDRSGSPSYPITVLASVPVSAAPTPNSTNSAAKRKSPQKGVREPMTEARFDIPVTQHTRVVSLIREIAELVLPAALRDSPARSPGNLPPVVFGAIYHNNKELAPDTSMSELPKDVVLHFYYGDELRQRGGKGCELRPYDASRPMSQQQQMAIQGKGGIVYPSSDYSVTSMSRGYGMSEENSEPRESSYPNEMYQQQYEQGYGGYGRSRAGSMNHLAGKASTAPSGNPWGMAERGKTYRIPIRSTADAPFHPGAAAAPPSKPTTPQNYQMPRAPGASPYGPPPNYSPNHNQRLTPNNQAGSMMMLGPNGEPVPVMMLMPYFNSPNNGMSPAATPLSSIQQEHVERGKTLTPNHGPHAARPPSVPISDSRVNRSQRFFTSSASGVSDSNEPHSISPVEVENTARKSAYSEQSPNPARPPPRKLEFGDDGVMVEERENHLVVNHNQGKGTMSSSNISPTRQRGADTVQRNRQETLASRRESKKKINSALSSGHAPPQTVYSVISNIEESKDYIYINIEIPEGVDPQLVCGLGDNSTNSVVVANKGTPIPEEFTMSANSRRGSVKRPLLPGGFEAIRRIRVHRDTPIGTLRELLNVSHSYAISVDDKVVREEIRTLAELNTPNEAVVSFVNTRKLRKSRSVVIPPEFLTAMTAPPPPPPEVEEEKVTTIITKVRDAQATPGSTKKSRNKLSAAELASGPGGISSAEAGKAPKTPEGSPNHRTRANLTASEKKRQQDQALNRSLDNNLVSLHSGTQLHVMTPEKLALQDPNQTPRESHTTTTHQLSSPTPTNNNLPSPTSQQNRSGTKPPGASHDFSASPHARDEYGQKLPSASSSLVARPGLLTPSKVTNELRRSLGSRRSSQLVQLNAGASGRMNEATINVDELSSVDEEEAARMMMVAANSSSKQNTSALTAAERRRSSMLNISHQVTTRRARVKRTNGLLVGTAEEDDDKTEMNDTLAEEHLSTRRHHKSVTSANVSTTHKKKSTTTPPITLYTFKRRASENLRQESATEKMLITIQDPKHPNVIHRDVPVDQNCPVSILRCWLLREDDNSEKKYNASASTTEKLSYLEEAVASAHIYYRGELIPPQDEKLSFKTVTSFFPNGIFSFQPLKT